VAPLAASWVDADRPGEAVHGAGHAAGDTDGDAFRFRAGQPSFDICSTLM
jgi:hypothetical protein